MAKFSPIMAAVVAHARRGGLVLGICNGFQILCEAGLLPGALVRNRSLSFVCDLVIARIETTATPFTASCRPGSLLTLPIKHGEGCYVAVDHGLTAEEYAKVVEVLGRAPTFEELGVFGVMWSEHCSYKSSRAWLRQLPTTGPQVIQGPGENAGAVDIGEGLAAVFKIESHNHPSLIEPYQGAATCVGGIVRHISTMGARPTALLNSLRLRSLDAPGTRRLPAG